MRTRPSPATSSTSSAPRRSIRPPTRGTDMGRGPGVLGPVPGGGSVIARIRGDGSGGDPLLLLSHLDVVPAPPDEWTHDPFAAVVADRPGWGRGAGGLQR